MLSKKYAKLQNESDIRGIALDGVEGQEVNLTSDVIEKIAKSFANWLAEDKRKPSSSLRVSIGIDSRISGPAIKAAAVKGLVSMGCRVYDFGIASTPAMFMSTVTYGYEYDGAVMVTASHLPYNRNGLKFFTNRGGLEKQEIAGLLSEAESGEFVPANNLGSITNVDFMSVYADYLRKKMVKEIDSPENKEQPLKGFRIVVDAGNGAGGFFVDKVLIPLGADVSGSQFLEPDGNFPNHIPNPEDPQAIEAISKAVVNNNGDIGIIFDADVDRAGAVEKNGKEINRNRLIAMMSAIVLEEYPNSIIVTDSVTSTGLKTFIEKDLGGVHHRFKRGYKNVINEAIHINNEGKECHLAMETSGHGALKENYFLDDGAFLVTKILIKMAKMKIRESRDIGSLIQGLAEPFESKEFRMNIHMEDFKVYGNRIISDLKEYAAKEKGWHIAPDNYEGVRVSFDKKDGDGWFLLRLSLHEPLMPLNIESDSPGGTAIIAQKILSFLEDYQELDTSSIKAYVQ